MIHIAHLFLNFLLSNENIKASDLCYLEKLQSTEDLIKILNEKNCNIKTKEDLIRALPSSFKKNPILVYKSQSLQGPHKVDYVNPRALLHGMDGDLKNGSETIILSFNGNSKDEGYNSIEIFDDKNKKMFELNFDGKKPKLVDETNGKCLRCHGNPPRPIFQSYPNWEGVFGSQHNGNIPDEEKQGFKNFLAESKNNKNSIYSNLDFNYYENSLEDAVGSNMRFNFKLNNIFFNNFYLNNSALKNSDYRYAIAGAFKQCKNFFDFFPNDVKKNNLSNISKKYDFNKNWTTDRIKAFDKELHSYPRLFRLKNNHYSNYLKKNSQFKSFLLDTFSRQGLESATMSGAFLRFIFEGQGSNYASTFVDLMQNSFRTSALLEEDKIAQQFIGEDLSCDQLKELSLETIKPNSELNNCFDGLEIETSNSINSQINVLVEPLKAMKSKEPLALFQHYCIQCHGDKKQVSPPYLPLGNAKELKKYNSISKVSPLLRLKNYIMPPSYAKHQLPIEDRAIMIKFLEGH